jgi:hypothetical protein
MILTNTPNTAKQCQEHRLLVSIRFAVVMHAIRYPKADPMISPRVQQRLRELEAYLFNYNASQLLHQQYVGRYGELGHNYLLHIDAHTGKAEVSQTTIESIPELHLLGV